MTVHLLTLLGRLLYSFSPFLEASSSSWLVTRMILTKYSGFRSSLSFIFFKDLGRVGAFSKVLLFGTALDHANSHSGQTRDDARLSNAIESTKLTRQYFAISGYANYKRDSDEDHGSDGGGVNMEDTGNPTSKDHLDVGENEVEELKYSDRDLANYKRRIKDLEEGVARLQHKEVELQDASIKLMDLERDKVIHARKLMDLERDYAAQARTLLDLESDNAAQGHKLEIDGQRIKQLEAELSKISRNHSQEAREIQNASAVMEKSERDLAESRRVCTEQRQQNEQLEEEISKLKQEKQDVSKAMQDFSAKVAQLLREKAAQARDLADGEKENRTITGSDSGFRAR